MPMITFKDKPKKEDREETLVSSGSDMDYMRNISLPVNDDILGEAEIDQEVVVTIIGKVSAIRSSTSEDYSDKSITVKASSIEVYERESNEEDAAMSAGYKGETEYA